MAPSRRRPPGGLWSLAICSLAGCSPPHQADRHILVALLQPAKGRRAGEVHAELLCSFAARVANSSQRLLSACEAWLLVHSHLVLWRATCSSRAIQRSLLITGFLLAVSQPFFYNGFSQGG